jgi:hypothetical protein
LPLLNQNLAAREPKCSSYDDALEVIWEGITHILAVSINQKDKVAATSTLGLNWQESPTFLSEEEREIAGYCQISE